MNNPENLRDITEKVLYGLTADDSLKHRILQQVSQQTVKSEKKPFYLIPAFCTVLAALLITVFALNGLPAVNPAVPGEINVFTAGNENLSASEDASSGPVDPSVSADDILSIQITDFGTVLDSQQCAQLFRLLRDESKKAEISYSGARSEIILSVKDGTVLRFYAKEPYIFSGGSCWFCPAFFESARQAVTE